MRMQRLLYNSNNYICTAADVSRIRDGKVGVIMTTRAAAQTQTSKLVQIYFRAQVVDSIFKAQSQVWLKAVYAGSTTLL